MSVNANNAALNEILEAINKLPSSKEEQEKSIDITENGTTEVTPNEGMTLNKVMINVNVPTGGDDDLPDWDDDSPIIASGYGYNGYTMPNWEITEKGTMRWKINPEGSGVGMYAKSAGWSNTITPVGHPVEYMKVAAKVKQIDVSEEFTSFYMGYAVNCKRIRLPSSLTNFNQTVFPSLKEIIYDNTNRLHFINCYSIEKIVLSPSHITLNNQFALGCLNLKEINLENVTSFYQNCFDSCCGLRDLDIVFNAGLLSIGNKAFYRADVKSFTFQTPTGNPPTIHSAAFSQCKSTSVTLYDGWDMDLYVSDLPLTQESLHDIAEKYADMTGAEIAPVLRLGAANINKMDEEHIAMLENKNINYS